VRGEDKLRKSLKRQIENGGPLLVVVEDESEASRRLRNHVWADGIVQHLLRGGGSDRSRRALRFPPIAVRVNATNEDDGAFALQLINSGRNSETMAVPPMFLLISMGELRAVNVRSILLQSSNVKRATVQIRSLLGRFLSPLQSAANRISPSLLARQRKRAEDLVLIRGDWDVSRLVRRGVIDARDVVRDPPSTFSTTSSNTSTSTRTRNRQPLPSSSFSSSSSKTQQEEEKETRSISRTSSTTLKDMQDAEFEASLARDREKQRKKEEEELAKAMEMSIVSERKRQLEIKRQKIPDEPSEKDSGIVSFVFKLPGGGRLSRRFRASSETFSDMFNFLDVTLESQGVTSYSVNLAYPRRTFHRHDTKFDSAKATLSSQGLVGRIALLVVDLDR